MELSESPASPANDTSVLVYWRLVGLDRPLFSNNGHLVEHLGRRPVAQGLMRSLVVVEPEVGTQFPPGFTGVGVGFQVLRWTRLFGQD